MAAKKTISVCWHPQRYIIIAWAQGHAIEMLDKTYNDWVLLDPEDCPSDISREYRVAVKKPKYMAIRNFLFEPYPSRCRKIGKYLIPQVVTEEENEKDNRHNWDGFVEWTTDWLLIELPDLNDNKEEDKLIPHQHSKEIIEWANGGRIQVFSEVEQHEWYDVKFPITPTWDVNTKYRIAPPTQTVRIALYSSTITADKPEMLVITKEENDKCTPYRDPRFIHWVSDWLEIYTK